MFFNGQKYIVNAAGNAITITGTFSKGSESYPLILNQGFRRNSIEFKTGTYSERLMKDGIDNLAILENGIEMLKVLPKNLEDNLKIKFKLDINRILTFVEFGEDDSLPCNLKKQFHGFYMGATYDADWDDDEKEAYYEVTKKAANNLMQIFRKKGAKIEFDGDCIVKAYFDDFTYFVSLSGNKAIYLLRIYKTEKKDK